MSHKRILLIVLITGLIAGFFVLGLHDSLSLENLKAQQSAISAYRDHHYWQTVCYYALLYIAVTGLSLPGATILTLAGGALFGLVGGTIIVSLASTIGATLAFLSARFLFRDSVKARFGDRLTAIEAGFAKDGAQYLFGLRLVPLFPFFIINVLMGLTPIKTSTFYWVSQLGMLAGTIVYVNAGTQLGQLQSLSGILSPGLLAAFLLLGIFPLLTRRVMEMINVKKIYQRWVKPARFDNNIIVIGAGSGGLISAYLAAALKAKVALVEKQELGGDCLHTGCVPSKALISAARQVQQIKTAAKMGIKVAAVEVDFTQVMAHVQQAVKTIQPHDSIARYQELGVEVVQGAARLLSPWEVEVSDAAGSRIITAQSIIIAAGASPFIPAIPGIADSGYLTSETVWQLKTLPKRLVILGGGPIGCELAQCFARLGSEVTLVEMADSLLSREDPEVSELLKKQFQEEGIQVLTAYKAKEFRVQNAERSVVVEYEGQELTLVFDEVLIALGRAPNVKGYGLEELGVELTDKPGIATNEFQQTNYPNIFACGDVAGPYQFTHAASYQAWYAVVNALFGNFKNFRIDYAALPWVTFTDPEIARVGLNEQDARQQNIPYEMSRYDFKDLDRAITAGNTQGFVKVLTVPGGDRILGVTLVGDQAGELIAEFVLSMRHGLGLRKILGTVHAYPTLSEANKNVAGVWQRQHSPKLLLDIAERYNRWRRKD